jgi:hypothetical protein
MRGIPPFDRRKEMSSKPTPPKDPAKPDNTLPPEATTKPTPPPEGGTKPVEPTEPGIDNTLPGGEKPVDPNYGVDVGEPGPGGPKPDHPSYGDKPGQLPAEDGRYRVENGMDGPRGFYAEGVEIMLDNGKGRTVNLTADELVRTANYGFKVTKDDDDEEAKPKR